LICFLCAVLRSFPLEEGGICRIVSNNHTP
jgi:hypothetical protein